MNKCIVKKFVPLSIVLALLYGCGTYVWDPKDMNSRAGLFVEAELKPDSPFCGFLEICKFNLHYFFGRDYADNSRRKNVLYIPGGPGDIVDRANPILDKMRIGANFIYFDVRGTGFSVIPESNAYDRFLRADYVIEDIETLRKEVLDKKDDPETNNPWDAIYAHSWGTIVAQRYAAKYPKMVRKLILSAPVARSHADTESARQTRIVDNLIDIYERHRSAEGCNEEFAKPSLSDNPDLATMTFCFLEKDDLKNIRRALTTLLRNLAQDYGSTAFVQSFYSDLKNDKNFTEAYRYPREFFKALRELEMGGAGEKDGMLFEDYVLEKKINVAFFVGYYLLLRNQSVRHSSDQEDFACLPDEDFLKRLKTLRLKNNFCKRIERAESNLRTDRSNDDSPRARSVYGVYDGLTRWIFSMLNQERQLDGKGCFSGKAMQDIASGELLKKKPAMREQAKKLGISRFERICPWDPGRYRHDVETLIFTGDADSVTAGGQAKYFFENGLTPGKRILIQFPGAGHLMTLQVKASDRKETATKIASEFPSLVDLFLKRSVNQFIEDEDVLISKCAFGAKLFPLRPERNDTNQNSVEAKKEKLDFDCALLTGDKM